jgi:iron complex outermembrane recepter protein
MRSQLYGLAASSAALACFTWPTNLRAADELAVLQEIVVTARKRAEDLQRVPDSITAFSAEQIEERRIDRISDAIALTPNVHMVSDQDAATNIITVRGIGTNRNLAASVAYVVDGVVLPDSDAFSADLSDVERIEILKGPQGGLYGRNAIAGVINLTTKRPSNEVEGEVRAGYGSGETYDVFGALSGPLAGDNLLGRVTMKYRDTDGLIENRFTGRNLDGEDTMKTTARLIWEPTEALTFDLRGSYFEQDVDGALWFSTYDVLGTTGGRIPESLARIKPNQNDDAFSTRRVRDLALVAELDVDAGTFTSITAYDDVNVFFREDLDVTPLTLTNNADQSRKTRGVSQELRFTSPGDQRLRYIVGGYAQNTKRDVTTSVQLDFCYFVPLPFCPTPPGVESGILVPQNLNTTRGEYKQWAAFAQANYDITQSLELTVALRYDEDRREQLDVITGRSDEGTFSDLQPKVSLAWKTTDAMMFYATYAEGYKSGTFNPVPAPGAFFPLVVEQEGTDNYELGMKSSWLQRRLQVNAAAYYTDYRDAQIFQLDLSTGGQVAINADSAEIKGMEIEIAARPLPGLDVNIAYGYTDGTFTNFNGTGLNDGNRLPNSPRNGLSAGTRYEQPLNAQISLVTRVDFSRTGQLYFAEDNAVYQPSYSTVDLQLGLQGMNWSATLWGKNVLDKRFVTSAYSRAISPLIFGTLGIDPFQIDPGAQYGLDLRWRF